MTPLDWVLISVAIACLIGLVLWVGRSRQRKPPTNLPEADGQTLIRTAQSSVLSPPKSPLVRIKFKNAAEGDGLGLAVQEYGRDALNYGLASQGANFVIQAIEFEQRHRTLNIAYRFTDKGYRSLREGKVSISIHADTGQLLPELNDRKGHFTELAKGHKDVLGKLANVSSLVVAAAHIVVSVDTLHRLKRIETKLDQLLRGRRNDQLSKLERLYVRGGETLLSLPYGDTSPELSRYRDELYDLRSGWRRDIDAILKSAKDPTVKAWWNNPTLKTVLKWTPAKWMIAWSEGKVRTSRERALLEHLLPLFDIVRCVRLALLIDICLAQWDGSADLLFSHTLASEAESWDGIGRKLDEHVAKFEHHDEAPQYVEAVEATANAIRSYVAAITGESVQEQPQGHG
jgi:hypothetical protein